MKNQKKSVGVDSEDLICKDKCQLSRLVEMATLDDLTKVLNRKGILSCLEKEMRRVFRHKYPLSLLLIDLDHFKSINDKLGHLKGDFVLRESSQRMKESLREEDFLGRYGGDEFIAILPHTDFDGSMVVAGRLISNFKEYLLQYGKTLIPQTVSIGVASHISGETTSSFLERADRALYQAKEGGRCRYAGESNG
ncbi:MAG TPA: GGDEF domain-containing protein [Nitrospiria bacterium]|nr:GGDEF domain-containing protein [Nitrospiria bacterium]